MGQSKYGNQFYLSNIHIYYTSHLDKVALVQ